MGGSCLSRFDADSMEKRAGKRRATTLGLHVQRGTRERTK